MTLVGPFRALRYDPQRVELDRVLSPPYDVIAPDERAALYRRDPHHAVRLELTRDAADDARTNYSEVADRLAAWQRTGVLIRDSAPALYVLRQRFVAPSGEALERDGLFAELRLEDYSAGIVRPHERTLAGPKADRLKMLRATQANLSSVFLLYQDPAHELAPELSSALERPPIARARDAAGVEYCLAVLADPDAIERVQRFLRERPVVIADGHHRYETALAYRDECRRASSTAQGHGEGADSDPPWESTLAYLANAHAPGTLLLAIHRVIRKVSVPTDAAWGARLPGWEQQKVRLAEAGSIDAALAAHLEPLAGQPAFVADDASGTLRVFWKEASLAERLMVEILEREVMGPLFGLGAEDIGDGAVRFPKSAGQAARDVRAGEGTVALYLNPLTAEDVFRVTATGELMPQKSTFFHPKIPTGLVFRPHGEAS